MNEIVSFSFFFSFFFLFDLYLISSSLINSPIHSHCLTSTHPLIPPHHSPTMMVLSAMGRLMTCVYPGAWSRASSTGSRNTSASWRFLRREGKRRRRKEWKEERRKERRKEEGKKRNMLIIINLTFLFLMKWLSNKKNKWYKKKRKGKY